jgi:hypothetical protein
VTGAVVTATPFGAQQTVIDPFTGLPATVTPTPVFVIDPVTGAVVTATPFGAPQTVIDPFTGLPATVTPTPVFVIDPVTGAVVTATPAQQTVLDPFTGQLVTVTPAPALVLDPLTGALVTATPTSPLIIDPSTGLLVTVTPTPLFVIDPVTGALVTATPPAPAPQSPLPSPVDPAAPTAAALNAGGGIILPSEGGPLVVILVTPTPTPTETVVGTDQRPVSTPVPAPTLAMQTVLGMLASMGEGAAVAATWIWFLAGSIIFFVVAGALAGVLIIGRERRRYEVETTDDPFRMERVAPPARPTPAAEREREPGADWPEQLP